MNWGIVLYENKTWLPIPRNLIFQNKLIWARRVSSSLRFFITFYYDEIWSSSSPNCTPNYYTDVFALSLWKNKLFLPFLLRSSKDLLSSTFSLLDWCLVAENVCLPLLPRPIFLFVCLFVFILHWAICSYARRPPLYYSIVLIRIEDCFRFKPSAAIVLLLKEVSVFLFKIAKCTTMSLISPVVRWTRGALGL